MSTRQDQAWSKIIDPWWGKLLIGCLMLVFAWFAFARYERIETGGPEPVVVGRSEQMLYGLGGKWLVAGIPTLVGVGLLGWGIAQVARGKE